MSGVAHPLMFDEDDPVYQRVRALALGLPEADMKVSHGRPAFFTRKVFCYYGGSHKVEGTWVEHAQSILVLANLGDQAALRALPEAYVPGYLGASGWTGLDLTEDADWDEVTGWIRDSYRATAVGRLRAQLDA